MCQNRGHDGSEGATDVGHEAVGRYRGQDQRNADKFGDEGHAGRVFQAGHHAENRCGGEDLPHRDGVGQHCGADGQRGQPEHRVGHHQDVSLVVTVDDQPGIRGSDKNG